MRDALAAWPDRVVLILEEDWRLGFAVVRPSTRYAASRRDSLLNRCLSGVAIDQGGIPTEISAGG